MANGEDFIRATLGRSVVRDEETDKKWGEVNNRLIINLT